MSLIQRYMVEFINFLSTPRFSQLCYRYNRPVKVADKYLIAEKRRTVQFPIEKLATFLAVTNFDRHPHH